MHFAYWMVFIAALLPYAAIGLVKSEKGYDNANPRDWEANRQGWRKRADWAHRNHFEAFAPFAAAVIIAELTGAAQPRLDLLAGVFIALRIAYTAAYLANIATLRTLLWVGGFGVTIAIFLAGI